MVRTLVNIISSTPRAFVRGRGKARFVGSSGAIAKQCNAAAAAHERPDLEIILTGVLTNFAQIKARLPAFFAALALCTTATGDPVVPHRSLLLQQAGMVIARDDGNEFRGSGAIAGDRRLVFGCAHVIFADSRWLTDLYFAPGWHGAQDPTGSALKRLRGARYLQTYAELDAGLGGSDPQTFAVDFAVMYAFAPLGAFSLPLLAPGAPAAVTNPNLYKMIVGYPAEIDFSGVTGAAYQHVTGPFQVSGEQITDSYYDLPGVSTGPGNSGGPLLVFDPVSTDSAELKLAGVLVSGDATSAGVNLLDDDAQSLAAQATAKAGVTLQTRVNKQKLVLPDRDRRYQERRVQVSAQGKLALLEVSLDIRTHYRGDLDVYLVSPGGRSRWLNKHSQQCCSGHLQFKARDLTPFYARVPTTGTWRLRMRDIQAGDRATFRSVSVTVGAGT